MKRTHLAVILIPLAFALPSCGGDDSNESTSPTAGAGTSTAAERPQSNSQDSTNGGAKAKDKDKESAATGSGGSSSADAERAAGQPKSSKENSSGSGAPTAPRPEREKAAEAKTPEERIAALSPSDRRKLHKDLYEQGKNVCYAYGPKQLAKEYHLTGVGAQAIAREYARLYEAQTPVLILPFQQGCLAGFRKFARNPPKT